MGGCFANVWMFRQTLDDLPKFGRLVKNYMFRQVCSFAKSWMPCKRVGCFSNDWIILHCLDPSSNGWCLVDLLAFLRIRDASQIVWCVVEVRMRRQCLDVASKLRRCVKARSFRVFEFRQRLDVWSQMGCFVKGWIFRRVLEVSSTLGCVV